MDEKGAFCDRNASTEHFAVANGLDVPLKFLLQPAPLRRALLRRPLPIEMDLPSRSNSPPYCLLI